MGISKEKYLLGIFIVALVVTIIIVLVVEVSKEPGQVPGQVLGQAEIKYKFNKGKDAHGNDIEQLKGLKNNIKGLRKWCNENSKCKGFNSNGYMKRAIGYAKIENRFPGPRQGIYIKKN